MRQTPVGQCADLMRRPAPIGCPKAGDVNYSIIFMDDGGHTQRSEFLPFGDDAVAVRYAQDALPSAPLVEVWKDNHLVARFGGGAAATANLSP